MTLAPRPWCLTSTLFLYTLVPGPALAQDARPAAPALERFTIRYEGGEYTADRARLRVREDRTGEGGGTAEVAFIRLCSTSTAPGPAVFYLAGGPGDSATRMARGPGWEPLLAIADVVLLDQRGTGQSKPLLVWTPEGYSAGALFADGEDATKEMTSGAARAAEHFRAQGVCVPCYNTVENAADVDEVRRALGYERISLIGHSYGTHLGLEVVRRFGAHVDRFVSVGTAGTGDMHRLPADLDAHVKMLSAVIAADPTVGGDVPDFAGLLRHVIERARRKPFRVAVQDPARGRIEVDIGARGVQMIVLRDLGDVEDIVVLPRLLYTLDNGDTSLLEWFVRKRYPQFAVVPVMTLAMRGASGATAQRWALMESQAPASLFGMTRVFPSKEVAGALGVRDLGDAFRAPVRSDVSTLFVSGTLDANTPPSQAEAVRAGFPNSGHLIVENGGHEDLLGRSDVRARLVEFLKGGPARSETIRAPALKFIPVKGPAGGHPSLEG